MAKSIPKLPETGGNVPTTMQVVGGDGSVKEVKGHRQPVGRGTRASAVEAFRKAVAERANVSIDPQSGELVPKSE